jgi:hypothetical protein
MKSVYKDRPVLERMPRVKFGDTEAVLGPGISAEDEPQVRDALDKQLRARKEEAERNPEAGYALELMFGTGFSIVGNPCKGALTFWKNGVMGGQGQTKIYLCPNKECEAVLPECTQGWHIVFCPTCGKGWKESEIVGELFALLPITKWAELVLRYFIKFGMDADIRVKYHPRDIREAAQKEQQRQLGGELLDRVRTDTVRVYPMRDMIRESSAGADLYRCILTRLRP